MDDLPHDPTAGHTGFERELPDNSVEYLLFIIDHDKTHSRNILQQLEELRKAALNLFSELTRDYIWQRDEFNIELKNQGGLVYLHGIIEYGDAVEDEWLTLHVLLVLTKLHPNIWLRIFDTDGEFLLVEAANVLPKWLSPEIDHNRVWINQGNLYVIPLDEQTSRSLELEDAVRFVQDRREKLVHSTFVQEEAFYRLEKYPKQIEDSIHRSMVKIPRRLAYILHELPKSVAPAVEAFYLRDALSLKPILSSTATLTFPPVDLVTVSVRFSKVLYAQLRSQRFETPLPWRAALPKSFAVDPEARGNDEETRRLEAGMKLTCGFEMLSAKAASSRSRTVRELAILVEDMKEDGDSALPEDSEIKSWEDVDRNDGEDWLDINYEDFERELSGKKSRSKASASSKGGFGDAQAQDNLRKIVSRFEAFLNDDTAGLDGAELDEMDFDDDKDETDSEDEDSEDEDKEVSFDEEEFARLMKEMMGLPAESGHTAPRNAKDHAVSTRARESVGLQEEEEEEDDVEEIRKLTSQFEAELNTHGALKLEPAKGKQAKQGKQTQLQGTATESNSREKGKQPMEDEEEDSDADIDIDYNLATNLLESFKSQGGMSGPTGNMMSMMGLNLPRDEDDGDSGQGQEHR